jgi:cell division protein FtsB
MGNTFSLLKRYLFDLIQIQYIVNSSFKEQFMKKALSTGVFAFVFVFIFTGIFSSCTPKVSKTEYDKILSDLSIVQTQLATEQIKNQSMQKQVSDLQTQTQLFETQLSAAQTQNQSLQAQISSLQDQTQSLQSDLQSVNIKVDKAKTAANLIDSIMQILRTDSISQLANYYTVWSNSVKFIGDPSLSAKFNILVNASDSYEINMALEDFVFYFFPLQARLLQSETVKLGEKFYLSIGETMKIDGQNLSLRFDDVTNDSRCATGVT